jgi:hypothetical protein
MVDKNLIAHNGGAGVEVTSLNTHAAILQNTIDANRGLGIDLAPLGKPNCSTKPPGPNDYIRCPVIAHVTSRWIGGSACPGCRVEVYVATNEKDDLGFGEGQTYLGSTSADRRGAWRFGLTARQRLPASGKVTATATGGTGIRRETSEFAFDMPVAVRVSQFNVRPIMRTITVHKHPWRAVHQYSGSLVVTWKMAAQEGVFAFNVIGAGKVLNKHPIRALPGGTYTAWLHWKGNGKVALVVILKSGLQLRAAVHPLGSVKTTPAGSAALTPPHPSGLSILQFVSVWAAVWLVAAGGAAAWTLLHRRT